MLVPSKTANGAPANSGSVEERICPPGARDVRLQQVAEGGRAGGGEARDRRRCGRSRCSRGSPPIAERRAAAVRRPGRRAAARRRGRRSSRRDRRAGPGSEFASPARLSTRTIPIAPAACARARLRAKVQVPRETSAIAPVSEPAGQRASRRRSRLPGGPQRCAVDRLAVRADDRADVDERLVAVRPRPGRVAGRRRTGSCCRLAGAPGAVTRQRRREDVRVRDGGDRDRVGRGARRAGRAERRSRRGRCRPRSPGRRPRRRRSCTASISASLAGSVCGPPPEKLITSMPSLTAASNAATISGVLRDVADRRRHVEDAVVAEPRARRDAGEPVVGGWSAPAGAVVPASPAAIPATCVPWNEACAVERRARPGRPEPGPGKTRATITFGVVHFVPPFGKPAGYVKPAGLKNGFVWSMPSSTTPILMPSPLRAGRRRERVGADHGRAAVRARACSEARVDLARRSRAAPSCGSCARAARPRARRARSGSAGRRAPRDRPLELRGGHAPARCASRARYARERRARDVRAVARGAAGERAVP